MRKQQLSLRPVLRLLLRNTGKQVHSLFTLVHAQFALTNSLLQHVLTSVVAPRRGAGGRIHTVPIFPGALGLGDARKS
jgi:hypothetical protein